MVAAIGSTLIQWKSYGPALFYANASTPVYQVLDTELNKRLGVPIPPNAFPAAGSDGHLTIIDNDPASTTYQCEYDMWQAGTVGGSGTAFNYSSPHASVLQRSKTTESGWIHGRSVRGASSTAIGGAITSAELAAGVIPHALAFVTSDQRADNGLAWLPSYNSGGSSTASTALGDGFRLRLNPSYDASALPAWQQTIATALKTYGAYVVDGGGYAFEAVDNSHSGIGPAYPWGATTYPGVSSAMISNLQVLTIPPRVAEIYDVIANHPCGNFN